SLLVLAAGMGSRYGGLKQLDSFGPNGETIIDYSIYDAMNAGFDKVVFVIRSHFREAFEKYFDDRIGGHIELCFVEQELYKIPQGIDVNPDREKPWGTAHAVLMGENEINDPFAVINADDYYGQESYQTLIDYFSSDAPQNEYAVVSYLLKNTLSDHGSVNRGICYSDKDHYLTKIIETLQISRTDEGTIISGGESDQKLTDETLVSMNMFGFNPSFFELTKKYFRTFLEKRGMELKSEFFIPFVLDEMINQKEIKVKVLESPAKWFGVTYKEDKPIVQAKIQDLINKGVYPQKLWD
ncbi:MAG: NTP transferase domain-containing protein, partial [Saprospiraceae bacterium]|nr:NTP transferase domain-containing protein [Saprospiraceae bacterium]